jgi:hypothetical protein
MKALAKLLLVVFGWTASVRAQESSPTPNAVDEPALPNSKLEIPHPPSVGLLPESGALPEPTPRPTPGIYFPLKTKNTVVASTGKPPLLPKRFEEVRSIAMRNPHVAYLLQRANKASTSSARRRLMRSYYLAVCARMRVLEPGLKSSINAYQAEKTGASTKVSNAKTGNTQSSGSKRRSHHTRNASTGTHSIRHKHAYSHRVIYPSDYDPDAPYGPYGPYSGY